jgi:hypothetical protein
VVELLTQLLLVRVVRVQLLLLEQMVIIHRLVQLALLLVVVVAVVTIVRNDILQIVVALVEVVLTDFRVVQEHQGKVMLAVQVTVHHLILAVAVAVQVP